LKLRLLRDSGGGTEGAQAHGKAEHAKVEHQRIVAALATRAKIGG
jgi:hypothetical protein